MPKTLKALSKQLFGARYEQIGKSLLASFILFLALYSAEIRLTIAPFILYLTSTMFTAGVMWQALNATHNSVNMLGMFMLPFENRQLTFAYMLAFSGYTLLTKSTLVWAIFFAVAKWSGLQIMIALLCGCNACFTAAAIYLLLQKKRPVLAGIWAAILLMTSFGIRKPLAILVVMLINLGLAVLSLFFSDAYTYYRPVYANAVIRHTSRTGSVLIYLLRYLLTNKNYLINTLGLWGIACFLPFILGSLKGLNAIPLGFAVLCLNTPICILLSCDPSLEQAIRALPRQAIHFCSRYCLFIFFIHMISCSIYLCSWQIWHGSVSGLDFLAASLFALQSAILSVLLEWLLPIRNWKIESDLWHHPRKYLVPLLMLLIAAFINTWTPAIWVWLFILLTGCLGLLIKARRI